MASKPQLWSVQLAENDAEGGWFAGAPIMNSARLRQSTPVPTFVLVAAGVPPVNPMRTS